MIYNEVLQWESTMIFKIFRSDIFRDATGFAGRVRAFALQGLFRTWFSS